MREHDRYTFPRNLITLSSTCTVGPLVLTSAQVVTRLLTDDDRWCQVYSAAGGLIEMLGVTAGSRAFACRCSSRHGDAVLLFGWSAICII